MPADKHMERRNTASKSGKEYLEQEKNRDEICNVREKLRDHLRQKLGSTKEQCHGTSGGSA